MRADMRIAQPKSLTEMVVARLEQAIVDGEFALGEAISEETLAKTFGVSRTPVRDALTALQRSGLVVVLPKRGSFVFRPSAADTAALCDYRYLLECEGLRLSRLAGPAEAKAAMDRAITAMEATLTTDRRGLRARRHAVSPSFSRSLRKPLSRGGLSARLRQGGSAAHASHRSCRGPPHPFVGRAQTHGCSFRGGRSRHALHASGRSYQSHTAGLRRGAFDA